MWWKYISLIISREWEWKGKGKDNIHTKFRGTRFLEGAGSNMWNCACTRIIYTNLKHGRPSSVRSNSGEWLNFTAMCMVTFVYGYLRGCTLCTHFASCLTVFLVCIDQNVWPWRERSPAYTLDPSSVARFLVNVKWCAWQLASFKAIYTCWNMYRDTDILFLDFMKLRISLEQSIHGETCICILPFLIKNILSLVLY